MTIFTVERHVRCQFTSWPPARSCNALAGASPNMAAACWLCTLLCKAPRKLGALHSRAIPQTLLYNEINSAAAALNTKSSELCWTAKRATFASSPGQTQQTAGGETYIRVMQATAGDCRVPFFHDQIMDVQVVVTELPLPEGNLGLPLIGETLQLLSQGDTFG